MTHSKKDPQFSRREFLGQVGTLAAVAASAPSVVGAEKASAPPTRAPLPGEQKIKLRINKQNHILYAEPRVTLLDALRERLQLSGTKKGCDHGQCGACTVHINGRRVNACLTLAIMHEGDEITTIEGLGTPEKMHPMQNAFVECDGYQCGYCTPGQIMSAVSLNQESIGESDAEVREAMSGNICRCGAYQNILSAIHKGRKA